MSQHAAGTLWDRPPDLPPVDSHVRVKDRKALGGQNEQVLRMLRAGPVTPKKALEIGCMRLAARIHDLREAGYEIKDAWEPGSRTKVYSLTRPE